MTSPLELQIRGGTIYPNRSIDITVDVEADLSAYQYHAVGIDSNMDIFAINSVSAPNVVGVLQNAPNYSTAVIRCAGITRMLYAEAVALHDLVYPCVIAGKEGRASVWDTSHLGHTHAGTLQEIVHSIFVVNFAGLPVTGSTNSQFTKTLHRYSGSAFTTSSETVTVTEASGGEYLTKYTPQTAGAMYRLRVAGTSGAATNAVITPNEFQEVPYTSPSSPSSSSVSTILGQALEAGASGDVGLVILRPQMF